MVGRVGVAVGSVTDIVATTQDTRTVKSPPIVTIGKNTRATSENVTT